MVRNSAGATEPGAATGGNKGWPDREALAARPGPETVTWRIHRERVLVLALGRAVLMQVAHPLVAQGVADHSTFRSAPGGRLRRLRHTLGAFLDMTFGPPEALQAVVERINAIHDRVHGRLREPAGRFAAGTSYSAHDPALLRWVHATLLDSFLVGHQRLVGPLSRADEDAYCAETAAVEPLLGIPEGNLPRSGEALEACLADMLAGGDIAVGRAARALARDIVQPPAPAPVRPAIAVGRFVTVGLLPPPVRDMYGFRWSPRRESALECLCAAIRGGVRLAPPALRFWPQARAAPERSSSGGG